ncbi:glycine zipper 2TM domain-containing protein [Sphingomonas sp. AX6]|uniref:glycine zipper 2TM domain-containing protein n=1 Tax=Sphingomonas sp. AX6 TaxID=2653171 RepID=UPI0012EFD524|nr:glycine zipper 2TM domain-containing protein [Sphingomonas sp. AX6]VXC82075.1 Glycine zipper 2TM domain-containing protein [Sphingomonas sp. AX6]
MLNKLTLVGAAFAMGATALAVPAAPAQAASFTAMSSAASYGDYDQRYRGDRRYNNRNYRNERRYQNNQRCKDGDGGTVIGAVAGGLLGNQVAGRGDRLVGTVLGGAVGALAGRAIDRSDPPRGCRRSR